MERLSAVSVQNLAVRRGGREVFSGLSLEVPRGQVVGLMGPSGSGKTTLLRSVAGTQITSGGVVTVLGQPAGSAQLRGRIGYMTQAPSVYDDLTAAENLAYFARLLGRGRDAVEQAIREVNLGPEAHRPVSGLSGGQRSRVSLAAALVGNPDLLVLDEPTVGLDPLLRQELWKLFAQLAERGTSLLVSSHVMDEASRCGRLLLLHKGRLLADLTPMELLEQTGARDADRAFLVLLGGEP
ncbi:heme ABC exporter ATP-binding protein CcmA [Arthrobacter sp. Sa2BUA2]|uniref:Heme ABC exporter ATP-binding protein CcmA n=1 Tax=Arthrobacter pullicola TaxID=2762224 RepID=A0ABR8YHA0_9MICC|nr:heme ABC exporter ATP-binding protein CcmA [Arthrobacter pullicola]MBD8043596.1 heme ABC exporter ATP-binding protein CcmA [Arthrobacter pullicola]